MLRLIFHSSILFRYTCCFETHSWWNCLTAGQTNKKSSVRYFKASDSFSIFAYRFYLQSFFLFCLTVISTNSFQSCTLRCGRTSTPTRVPFLLLWSAPVFFELRSLDLWEFLVLKTFSLGNASLSLTTADLVTEVNERKMLNLIVALADSVQLFISSPFFSNLSISHMIRSLISFGSDYSIWSIVAVQLSFSFIPIKKGSPFLQTSLISLFILAFCS